MSVRIGVDVGGTFTDIVCFDEQGESFRLLKVPSTPDRPSTAVIEGTRRVLNQFEVPAESVGFFIHGTTVATNTILERKGAEVALLVTAGFRDVPYIMRQDRPRLYDYFQQRPQPLIPRERRFEVPERMLYTGQVSRPLQEEPTRQLLRRLNELEVRDIAVCLLPLLRQPVPRKDAPGLDPAGDPRGPRLPLFRHPARVQGVREVEHHGRQRLCHALGRQLSPAACGRAGLSADSLGTPHHAVQRRHHDLRDRPEPLRAHGAVGTRRRGPERDWCWGGRPGWTTSFPSTWGATSADVAVARDGNLHFAEETEIAGQILKIPAIEINTVGAGGGSIAWVDSGGALQVGPQSAGAHPGPACYRRGGSRPTVTDANVVLGRLNASHLLGGEMAIDAELSARAIGEGIATPLGLELVEAAEGIIRVINAVMAKAIRRLSVEKGYDPREFTLVSFGGGGPLHAAELAARPADPAGAGPAGPRGQLRPGSDHGRLSPRLRAHGAVEAAAGLAGPIQGPAGRNAVGGPGPDEKGRRRLQPGGLCHRLRSPL